MAHQDDCRVVLLEVRDGGDGRTNTRVVGDDAILQGHVEVDSHEDALAVDVDVTNGLLGKCHVVSF